MKKIFNYILASGLALSAVSCDFTDLDPTDKIGSNEIFSSVSTLEQTIYGAYSQLSLRTTVGVSAVLSDDVCTAAVWVPPSSVLRTASFLLWASALTMCSLPKAAW